MLKRTLLLSLLAITVPLTAHAFTISGSFLTEAPTYRSNPSNNGGLVGVAVSDGTALTAGSAAWSKLNAGCEATILIGDETTHTVLGSMQVAGSANGEIATPNADIRLSSVIPPAGDIIEAFANTAGCTKGTIAFSAQ
jgi:hypothetical protein